MNRYPLMYGPEDLGPGEVLDSTGAIMDAELAEMMGVEVVARGPELPIPLDPKEYMPPFTRRRPKVKRGRRRRR